MTQTFTLSSPASIPAFVEAALGFTPSDSLVVLGLGGGPSARVDIDTDTVEDAVMALATAASHWRTGVLVAIYSDYVTMGRVERAFRNYLPSVEVKIIVDIDEHDVVTDADGVEHRPVRPEGLPTKTVRPSRESIVADAERVVSSASAFRTAVEAYREGDGAKSWIYLDRFHALNEGERTDQSLILERLLTLAVDPKSDAARVLA